VTTTKLISKTVKVPPLKYLNLWGFALDDGFLKTSSSLRSSTTLRSRLSARGN